jgi:hypothetical protein
LTIDHLPTDHWPLTIDHWPLTINHWPLTIYHLPIDHWPFTILTTFVYFWLLLTTFDYFWLLLTTFDYFWLLLTTVDSFWLLLTTSDHFWPLLCHLRLLLAQTGHFRKPRPRAGYLCDPAGACFKVVGSPVGSTIPLNILIYIFLCLIILSVVLCFTQHRFSLWDQGIYFIHSTVFINNTLCLIINCVLLFYGSYYP